MQSKLANTLYSQKIAEVYPEIMSCSVQPGAVATDIGGDDQGFFVNLLNRLGTGGKYLTPEEGAYNMCWVATTERENLENGAYYEPVGWRGTMTAVSKDQVARTSFGSGLRKSWKRLRYKVLILIVGKRAYCWYA